jgi:hypothetical protein
VLFEFVVHSSPELVELGSIGRPTIINALKFVSGLQGGPIEHQDRPDPLVIVARQGGEVCGDPSLAERLKATACEAREGLRKPLSRTRSRWRVPWKRTS